MRRALSSVVSSTQDPRIPLDLEVQPVPGDGHCLYHAVALYLGQDQQSLRTRVADYLELRWNEVSDFILLDETQTPEMYIARLRTTEYADHIEIEMLMRMLQRPIIVVDRQGQIRNPEVFDRFSQAEAIYVQYNGLDHYDGMIQIEAKFESESQLGSDVEKRSSTKIPADFLVHTDVKVTFDKVQAESGVRVFLSGREEITTVPPNTIILQKKHKDKKNKITAYFLDTEHYLCVKEFSTDQAIALEQLLESKLLDATVKEFPAPTAKCLTSKTEVDVNIPPNQYSFYYAVILGALIPAFGDDKMFNQRTVQLFGWLSPTQLSQLKLHLSGFSGVWCHTDYENLQWYVETFRNRLFDFAHGDLSEQDFLQNPDIKQSSDQPSSEKSLLGTIPRISKFRGGYCSDQRDFRFRYPTVQEKVPKLIWLENLLQMRIDLWTMGLNSPIPPRRSSKHFYSMKLFSPEVFSKGLRVYRVIIDRQDLTKIKQSRQASSHASLDASILAFPVTDLPDFEISASQYQEIIDEVIWLCGYISPVCVSVAFETAQLGNAALMNFLLRSPDREFDTSYELENNIRSYYLAQDEVQLNLRQDFFRFSNLFLFVFHYYNRQNYVTPYFQQRLLQFFFIFLKELMVSHLAKERRKIANNLIQDKAKTDFACIENYPSRYSYEQLSKVSQQIFYQCLEEFVQSFCLPLVQVVYPKDADISFYCLDFAEFDDDSLVSPVNRGELYIPHNVRSIEAEYFPERQVRDPFRIKWSEAYRLLMRGLESSAVFYSIATNTLSNYLSRQLKKGASDGGTAEYHQFKAFYDYLKENKVIGELVECPAIYNHHREWSKKESILKALVKYEIRDGKGAAGLNGKFMEPAFLIVIAATLNLDLLLCHYDTVGNLTAPLSTQFEYRNLFHSDAQHPFTVEHPFIKRQFNPSSSWDGAPYPIERSYYLVHDDYQEERQRGGTFMKKITSVGIPSKALIF